LTVSTVAMPVILLHIVSTYAASKTTKKNQKLAISTHAA
jgi:hypothetical protein